MKHKALNITIELGKKTTLHNDDISQVTNFHCTWNSHNKYFQGSKEVRAIARVL